MNITDLEYELLDRIAHDEYQPINGATPVAFDDVGSVWAECVLESKQDGGVFTSLQSKGLVGFQQGKPYGLNGETPDTDSTLWLTAEGFDVWHKMHAAKSQEASAEDALLARELATAKEYAQEWADRVARLEAAIAERAGN